MARGISQNPLRNERNEVFPMTTNEEFPEDELQKAWDEGRLEEQLDS